MRLRLINRLIEDGRTHYIRQWTRNDWVPSLWPKRLGAYHPGGSNRSDGNFTNFCWNCLFNVAHARGCPHISGMLDKTKLDAKYNEPTVMIKNFSDNFRTTTGITEHGFQLFIDFSSMTLLGHEVAKSVDIFQYRKINVYFYLIGYNVFNFIKKKVCHRQPKIHDYNSDINNNSNIYSLRANLTINVDNIEKIGTGDGRPFCSKYDYPVENYDIFIDEILCTLEPDNSQILFSEIDNKHSKLKSINFATATPFIEAFMRNNSNNNSYPESLDDNIFELYKNGWKPKRSYSTSYFKNSLLQCAGMKVKIKKTKKMIVKKKCQNERL